MNAEQTFSLIASAAFLGLAAVAAARGTKNPLALPTAMLCADLFGYNSLEFLGNLTAERHWEWLESACAAMAAPLLFHLTLAFLGSRRAQRRWLAITYLYFGLIATSCVAPFLSPSWAGYPGGSRWALAMLAGVLPTFLLAGLLLVRHYRASGSAEERARTQMFIGTVVLGVGGPATDLAAIAGATAVPRLAAACMLASALLLTALALRFRLVRGTLSLVVVNALLIGAVGVVAQLLVFRWAGTRTALLVVGTISITLVLLGAARAIWSDFTEYRERTAHLATLGRLSAQMAHDIRNPLAAIRGAAQYLDEERKRGADLSASSDFLDLILEQTERLERVVREYHRLGRAETSRTRTEVGPLVRAVVDGARLAVDDDAPVTLEAQVEVEGSADLDPELVTTALENLVRNAIEALAERGGTVTVRADQTQARVGRTLRLCVIDDGPGMDARTRERAEEAFFTTKAQGSGLGLAFVRRVAEAHGGRMTIDSTLGRGTEICLLLPEEAADG